MTVLTSPHAECLPEHLQPEVEKCQVDGLIAGEDEKMPVFNALTEEKLVDLPIPFSIRLRRKKLLELLSSGIDVMVWHDCYRVDEADESAVWQAD